MLRGKIEVTLYPKGYAFEGEPLPDSLITRPLFPAYFALEIADAELLIRDFERCPEAFEQAAARSLREAIEAHNEHFAQEDLGDYEES